jgi:hypothetical protein
MPSGMDYCPTFVKDFNNFLPESGKSVSHDSDIVKELKDIRKEIADLKATLSPNIIITGPRCIDEYWRITGERL